MKLKGSSSFRRENMRNEASSGKDIARALAKLSPGGMSEFVQHVPASVAGCCSITSLTLVAQRTGTAERSKLKGWASGNRVLRVALPGP